MKDLSSVLRTKDVPHRIYVSKRFFLCKLQSCECRSVQADTQPDALVFGETRVWIGKTKAFTWVLNFTLPSVPLKSQSVLFFSALKFPAIYSMNFILAQVAVSCPLDCVFMFFHQNQHPADSSNCCGASACVSEQGFLLGK